MAEGNEGADPGNGTGPEDGAEGRVGLDIGLGPMARGTEGDSNSTGSPFSLRHFLRTQDPPNPRVSNEALPDFVQDHITTGFGIRGFSSDNLHPAANSRLSPATEAMSTSEPRVSLPTPGQQPEVGSSKSLPDFLSDGPIRSRDLPQGHSVQMENERLQNENERLRIELNMLRQQLGEQVHRSESLELEMARLRRREDSPPCGFVEKLEGDLNRMTKRALTAENRLSRLRADNESLRAQIRRGTSGTASTSAPQSHTERLASQLRNAAYNAEASLRQLLTGVDNLRHLADTLDPIGSIPVKTVSSGESEDDDPDNRRLFDSSLPPGKRNR